MMFEEFLEKRRKKREAKERREAAYEAIESGSPENVKQTLEAARDDVNLGWCLKLAIERQDLKIFRDVMAVVDDPNHKIVYDVYNGSDRRDYTYTYSPIEYALTVKSTHDISLWLASNPRTNITGKLLDSARSNGMQDVASVLAKRIADLRRQEAAQLDIEAGQEPTLAEVASTAEPAAFDSGMAADDNGAAAGETWALMSKTSVAHVTSSPIIGRKLTEIFNFESRERVQITENLKTGAESIGKPERFDAIGEDAVIRAEAMLKQLNAEASKKSFRL